MNLQSLTRSQVLSIPIDEAWSFFIEPKNLSKITPPRLGLKIVSGSSSRAYSGQIIVYTVTPFFKLPFSWVTEINHIKEPGFFVDEQRLGPFRFWHHQHSLYPEGKDATRVDDIVHYQLPLGFCGRFFLGSIVAARLKDIFDYRERQLSTLFSSDSS